MNLYGFDLNLLKVLDALLSEGSTVAAARRIGLSQPAVSSALNRLRHTLDDPLFVRVGQRLEPTDRARDMTVDVREILNCVESILAGPDLFDPAKASLTFTLSGSDFFAEMLMPELARRISGSAPGIRVQMVDLVPDNHVETLGRNRIDLALTPATGFPEWSDHSLAFRCGFLVVARDGHPDLNDRAMVPGATIPLDLYCGLPHMLFSQEGKFEGIGDAALAQLGRRRNVAMTMPSFLGICRAVSESDMIALVPAPLGKKVAGKLGLTLYQPPMQVPPANLHMVWHRRATNNPAHRWLRELVSGILSACDTAE